MERKPARPSGGRNRRKFSKKQIADILNRYRRSDRSKREFCDHEGISYTSPDSYRDGNWFRKSKSPAKRTLRKKKDPFVELVPETAVPASPAARLNFPGGKSLEFFSMPDADLLKSLLEPVVSPAEP
jgi:hypothetical protein